MAAVMPGTVITFGAEYRRRPVLSLFGPKENREDGTLTVPDTHIRLQASIAITRFFPDEDEENLILRDDADPAAEPEDPRGRIVDIVA